MKGLNCIRIGVSGCAARSFLSGTLQQPYFRLASMLAILAGALVVGPRASAQTNFYSARTLFNSASTNRTDIDFESHLGDFNDTANGLTYDGVQFVGVFQGYATRVGKPTWTPNGTAVLTGGVTMTDMYLPANTSAIGFDFGTVPYGTSYDLFVDFDVTLADNSVVSHHVDFKGGNYSGPNPDPIPFFGVTSDQAIKQIHVNGYYDAKSFFQTFDNVSFGQVSSSSPVPEPAFYQMSALLALGGLGVLRHRRARRS